MYLAQNCLWFMPMWNFFPFFTNRLTGKPAFKKKTLNEMLLENANAEINFEIPEFLKVPPDAMDLLTKMLIPDPFMRISASEALKHHFFGDGGKEPKKEEKPQKLDLEMLGESDDSEEREERKMDSIAYERP